MLPFIKRLFRRHPPGFPTAVDARFDRTLVYEGSIRTGADLFGKGAARPLSALVYHQFLFEHGGKSCHFLVRDDERAMRFTPGERHRAYLDATGSHIRFREQESRAFEVAAPDAGEDEDG